MEVMEVPEKDLDAQLIQLYLRLTPDEWAEFIAYGCELLEAQNAKKPLSPEPIPPTGV